MDPVGEHCALQSCNVFDFLPIQCTCSRWFCRLHIPPDLHDCSAAQRHPSGSSTSTRPKCALSGCDKHALVAEATVVDQDGESLDAVPGSCPGCHLCFCVDHRHTQSHSCTGLAVGKDDVKHGTARAILAQKFPTTSTPKSHTPLARRRKGLAPNLAQLKQVNLMKLRHTAVPGDPRDRGSVVPVDQRFHVTVRLEITGRSVKEVTLWFRKTMITGKALDLVVQHFGVFHTASILRLEHRSEETASHVLLNHLELTAQLEDGSTVVLTDSRSMNE